jgi:hypothetical protein
MDTVTRSANRHHLVGMVPTQTLRSRHLAACSGAQFTHAVHLKDLQAIARHRRYHDIFLTVILLYEEKGWLLVCTEELSQERLLGDAYTRLEILKAIPMDSISQAEDLGTPFV